ncbi:MAG: hypothetical protein IGS39_14565 [Calothrix sp. C42_A2020_038]|nr:hypothetical protein [Calothrix sp. C42_A2020_038]
MDSLSLDELEQKNNELRNSLHIRLQNSETSLSNINIIRETQSQLKKLKISVERELKIFEADLNEAKAKYKLQANDINTIVNPIFQSIIQIETKPIIEFSHIGHKYLKQEIFDEREVTKIHEKWLKLFESIETNISRSQSLMKIAKSYNSYTKDKDNSKQGYFHSFSISPAIMSNLSMRFRVNFQLKAKNQKKLFLKEAKKIKVDFEKLNILLKLLEKHLPHFSNETSNFDFALLKTLLEIFGSSLTDINLNNSHEFVLIINQKKFLLIDVINQCHEYRFLIQKSMPNIKAYKQLINSIVNYKNFFNKIDYGVDLKDISYKITELSKKVSLKLELDDFQVTHQDLDKTYESIKQLSPIYTQINHIVNITNEQNAYFFNVDSVKAIIHLFGHYIRGLGIGEDGNSVIYFYKKHNYTTAKTFIDELTAFRNKIHKNTPIDDSLHFIRFSRQCIESKSLSEKLKINSFKEQTRNLSTLKNYINNLYSQVTVPDIESFDLFLTKKNCQIMKNLKQEFLPIAQTLNDLFNTTETGKICDIQSVTIENLILLFGRMDTILYNHPDRGLSIVWKYSYIGNFSNIMKARDEIISKNEVIIKKLEERIQRAEQSLANPAFIQKCILKQAGQILYKSIVFTIFCSGLGASALLLSALTSGYVESQSKHIALITASTSQARSLDELRNARDQIHKSIASIKAIPYVSEITASDVQKRIEKHNTNLKPLYAKIEKEQEALAWLTHAKELAAEAIAKYQKSPNDNNVLSKADDQLYEAISILQNHIPKDSYVAGEAEVLNKQYTEYWKNY